MWMRSAGDDDQPGADQHREQCIGDLGGAEDRVVEEVAHRDVGDGQDRDRRGRQRADDLADAVDGHGPGFASHG